jgi:plasmid stabilization system protein ParE
VSRVRLLPEAQADLLSAARFYERQRQGLGREFIRSLDNDIQSLGLQAGIHPRQYDCHRKLASRFPFAVYYRVQAEQVVVFAILDCRRDPDSIRARLKA